MSEIGIEAREDINCPIFSKVKSFAQSLQKMFSRLLSNITNFGL